MSYIYVGIGGFIGALARYYLSGLVSEAGGGFPYGTLVVNLLGCLFLGFFLAVAFSLLKNHAFLVAGVSSGFTGAFTTFSTFNLDTLHLIQSGRLTMALVYVLISWGGGLLLVQAGDRLGEAAVDFTSNVLLPQER